MPDKLLICTDLDRTLIPNGPQPESPMARKHFTALVENAEVALAYVSGRHHELVEDAINTYCLPYPDYIIGDVGTTIYYTDEAKNWKKHSEWDNSIAIDWAGKSHADLQLILSSMQNLQLQELDKQNDFKLSYYVPLHANQEALNITIQQKLNSLGVKANLIWSVDEAAETGLLDILPASASKFHAIEALMKLHHFDYSNTVFCGDSGNDIEVLISPISSVLVANSQPDVRELALRLASENNLIDQLYIAKGDFAGMNGNYSAGMLEGIAHYFPNTLQWMGLNTGKSNNE